MVGLTPLSSRFVEYYDMRVSRGLFLLYKKYGPTHDLGLRRSL